MKLSTWNWAQHPDPASRTKGAVIGPFCGVICYISVPINNKGINVQLKRISHA